MLLKMNNRLWRPDVAVDLGTATVRVAVTRGDYRFSVPSAVHSVPALAHGVVVNVDAAAEALRPALHRLGRHGMTPPRVLACAPSDTSPQEREAVVEACYRAGASAVALMPEPVAAALGDGVDHSSTQPALLVDIGDGVTDCAVIRQGRISEAFACRVACAEMREIVRETVRCWNGAALSDAEAARVVAEVGVEDPSLDGEDMPLLLRNVLVGGTAIPYGILQTALEPVARRIVGTVQSLLTATPGLRHELHDSGIRLSGGGALIPGFAGRIAGAVGLPVYVARNPLDSVVQGAKRVLPIAAEHDLWRKVGRSGV